MSKSTENVVDFEAAKARIKGGGRYDRPPSKIRSEFAKQFPSEDLVARAASLNPEVFLYGSEEDQAREFVRCGFLGPMDYEMSLDLLAILYSANVVTSHSGNTPSNNQDFDIGA